MQDDNISGQHLIDAFFDALRRQHLDQCQILLDSIKTLAKKQQDLKPWYRYFQGILAFETEHDWAKATKIFTRLLESALAPEMRGRVLYALGRSFDVQGRWQEAINAFKQNLSLAIELDQPADKAKAWKHIAISYCKGFTRGDFGPEVLGQAMAYCRLGLEALETISFPPPDVVWLKGTIWNTLGLIEVSLGHWDEAVACYRQELTICESQDDRHGIGLTFGNLGEVHQKRGDWSAARSAFQKALKIIQEFEDYYEETEALANLAFLHQEMGDYETALDYYTQAIQIIEELRTSVSTEAARSGFFATIVDIYANAVLLCLEIGRKEQAFDYIERARSRTFLDVLAAQSPDLSQKVEVKTITLAELQAALPDDALLLEYFTTGLEEVYLDQAAKQQGVYRHRFPPAKTLIFAVTPKQIQVHYAELSPNDLRPGRLDNVVEQHFLQPQIRRTLYDRLITPVESLLQDKRRLYLVPHGPLHYIPFQALIAPNGDTLLHESGPQIVYAPSATLLFQSPSRELGSVTGSCLTVGYNSLGETRLDFAEEEALTIANLTGGQALAGSLSKKTILYEQALNYQLLHLACHGEFDPESPLESFLHLAPDEILTALDILEHLRLRYNHASKNLDTLAQDFETHLTSTTFPCSFLHKFDYPSICMLFK